MSNEVYIIEDLVPVEISEVAEPAIGEYFYFIKGDGNMDKYLSQEYLALIEKKLGKQQAEAIKNALEILAPIFKDAPEDVKKAIAILAEAVGYGYPEPKDEYPEPVEKNVMSKLDTVIKLVERLSEEVAKLKNDILTEVKKQDNESEKKDEDIESEILRELDEIIRVLKERNDELNAILSGILNQ